MKKIFFIAALALARLCFAQTPSPAAPSGWQLGQGFDPTLPRGSARSGVSVSTPAPVSSPAASSSEASSSPTSRDRKSSESMSYVEGSIWMLTFVKTKSGSTDDYFKSISASLKPLYEEEKKQKMILDYKILNADSAEDRDFNVIIMVEYPNMATLQGSRERFEPMIDKIIGPAAARRDLATKRQDVREILATKMMREIWLK